MDILKGLTALSVAIICTPGLYMVRTLLDRGASATKKSLNRLPPEEIAKAMNRKDVLDFFSEKLSVRTSEFPSCSPLGQNIFRNE
uniref:ANK_REP_REGION domain-containing protein n=1 Tax=Caenorhabditis tropicalis TaxID=1561998 RepID=A0A1I7UJI6_9PELO